MSWAETLKGDVWTYASASHTTNSEGEPPPFEYLDRTMSVHVSYADMKVIRRNGADMKVIRRNGADMKVIRRNGADMKVIRRNGKNKKI